MNRDRLEAMLPSRFADASRSLLDRVAPGRRRQVARRQVLQHEEFELAKQVSPTGKVLAGPFAGLLFPLETSWAGIAAYLAGTYEEEIAASLLNLVARRPSLVIDVGAAEGYYAVGIARLVPDATVHAYDIDGAARRVCRKTAALNGVSNVEVHGRIRPADLQRRLAPGALVVCDCEGYELVLLDPEIAPRLAEADLLVEAHDFIDARIGRELERRFDATHEVELISATKRRGPYPHLTHLTSDQIERAVDEGRPVDPWPMRWVVMRSRAERQLV